MKIAHISTSSSGGGAAIAAFRLHQSLRKENDIQSAFVQRMHVDEAYAKENDITICPTDRSLFSRIRKRYNYHTEHFNWVKLNKHPRNYEIATFATTSYRIEELPIIQDADIIHLHWVAEFLNYPTFFKNIKQPIIWTLHDINPFRGMFHFDSDKEKNTATFGELDKKILQTKINAINKNDNITVVCLSDWMRQKSQLSPSLGRYPNLIIPNGLDFAQYPQLDKNEEKSRIGLNNGLKNILVVGASLENEQKGFNILFDAINKLDRKDFNFISIGQLSNSEAVRKDIQHLHIDKISNVSELNKYYAAADIVVIPSKEDNLPNTMLESFANGTPVMSFSNGGMAEHVKTGENGILINEIGVKPLSKAIDDFLNNIFTFDNNSIREYAINTFSDTIQTEKYIQLYKNILGK